MSPFVYDAEALGNKFIGKVHFAREITAAEFDERQGATLSSKIGADTVVFYLAAENLEASKPGTMRATFFSQDDRPISKWGGFLQSAKAFHITIKRRPDGTTDLEGKYLILEEKEKQVGKYGKSNTMEIAGIPSPEGIEALEKSRTEAVGLTVTPASSDEIAQTLLGLADGLSMVELEAQMIALGYKDWEKVLSELKAKQSIVMDGEKFKVV